MKVIKEGPGWGKETKCTGDGNGGGGCGSTLLVEKGDLYITSRNYIDNSNDYFVAFMCPLCKVETDLKDSDVPSGIRNKLPRGRTAWLNSNSDEDE